MKREIMPKINLKNLSSGARNKTRRIYNICILNGAIFTFNQILSGWHSKGKNKKIFPSRVFFIINGPNINT